ncbi:ROK family protein [Nocardia sp. NRRL S-836]|uniref:ROK family protein n=1 Tax=Nocardia sp. NRRL S-836 TaxID=1519492 RepID=UPI0018D1E616|nr:ROK family protein [Nocardia sp. NRRL S-836]
MKRGHAVLGQVLSLVHGGQVATRADLTAELGVTRATTGAVTGELEALGLIRNVTRPGGPAAARGRPSHRIVLDPDGPVVLAVQVHVDGYRVAVVGLGGVVAATTARRHRVGADPADVLSAAVGAGAELVGRTGRRCLGAGLAVPSAVAEPDGTALNPLHVAWPVGAPVRDVFTEQVALAGLDVPAFVANDINLAALAEHRHGAGRGATHLLMTATGHRGVGGAFVVGGRLYTGSSGLSMEVGHVTVNPSGRRCHCGNRGCLDVETDPVALLEAAGLEVGPDVAPLVRAVELVRAGHPAVEGVVERLAVGLAGLVNVLNPDRIVLGGLHAALLDRDPERLTGLVADRGLWERSVPLVPSALEHNSLVGAAELAWQPVLDDPLGVLG